MSNTSKTHWHIYIYKCIHFHNACLSKDKYSLIVWSLVVGDNLMIKEQFTHIWKLNWLLPRVTTKQVCITISGTLSCQAKLDLFIYIYLSYLTLHIMYIIHFYFVSIILTVIMLIYVSLLCSERSVRFVSFVFVFVLCPFMFKYLFIKNLYKKKPLSEHEMYKKISVNKVACHQVCSK